MNKQANMGIFQIVGYKNAGKTTLTQRMIAYLTRQGYRVASLKHHGHGGNPETVTGTDSDRHYQAGAVISGVQGDSELQLTLDTSNDWSWQNIQTLYNMVPCDIMLLEGYKSFSYPKIVLLRHEDDITLLHQVNNVAAIGCHTQLPKTEHTEQDIMTFLLDDLESIIPKLTAHMLIQVRGTDKSGD